jgi:hypothetical protein
MHSGAFAVRNIDALFVILGWDRYGFLKKHARTHYAGTHYAKHVFYYLVGSTGHIVHSGASGV